jgi:hypothetical protein
MTFMPIDDRPPNSYAICPTCHGKKVDPKKRKRKCPTCKGTGMDHTRCDKCYRRVHDRNSMEAKEEGVEYCDCYLGPPQVPWKLTGVPGER